METQTQTQYVIVNGTAYHAETPQAVINLLENSRQSGTRLRVFYGDTATGRDWLEENDVCGRVGRSTGTIKIPLLIKSSLSTGGSALLDNCIVKIMIGKNVVYQHPAYNQPKFVLREKLSNGRVAVQTQFGNLREICARFDTQTQAQRYIDFMTGKRMSR